MFASYGYDTEGVNFISYFTEDGYINLPFTDYLNIWVAVATSDGNTVYASATDVSNQNVLITISNASNPETYYVSNSIISPFSSFATLLLTPDEKYIYASAYLSSPVVYVYDISANNFLAPIDVDPTDNTDIISMIMSPDGSRVYGLSFAMAPPGLTGFTFAIDTSSNNIVAKTPNPQFLNSAIVISPDCSVLVTAANVEGVGECWFVFQASDLGFIGMIPTNGYGINTFSMQFSPDGSQIIAATNSLAGNCITAFDASSFEPINSISAALPTDRFSYGIVDPQTGLYWYGLLSDSPTTQMGVYIVQLQPFSLTNFISTVGVPPTNFALGTPPIYSYQGPHSAPCCPPTC